ncbi:MAG: DUF4364 family protein [Eubacteriales bacterium]|nr:DUF4364 family protein [Eubacteriales bacterium]
MDKQKVAALLEHLRIVPHKNLILLYVLEKVRVPLSIERIDFITGTNGWMEYFDMVDALAKLAEQELVTVATDGGAGGDPLFGLSEEGAEALELFRTRLPASLRAEIDEFLLENERVISLTARHRSRIRRDEAARLWRVVLTAEGAEITLSARSHDEGMAICDNWTKNADDLLERLRGERKP